jgi:hypothetical protein
LAALTTWVAPNSRARSSFPSTTSTAMICRAPAMRAPWITDIPTPPTPSTATVEAGATFARLSTAPTPVTTPQLIKRRLVQGHVLSDLHQGVLVDEHLFGLRANSRGLGQRPSVLAQPGRRVRPAVRLVGAEVRPPDETVVALAAEERETLDDKSPGWNSVTSGPTAWARMNSTDCTNMPDEPQQGSYTRPW